MPSPTTALDLIRGALSLTNAVGVDQTLTADQVSTGLSAFNDLMELFSTNNLAVYASVNQTFNTVAAQATYTIGSGGNWNTTWPVRINDPAYTTINGTSFPCVSMTQDEYNTIPVKAQQQQFPYRYLWVNSYPLAYITLWPVPSGVVPITWSMDTVLSAVSSAGTSISFPQGYAMAFKYKLAIMLAPLFGKRISNYPEIVQIANETFGAICRMNKKINVMGFDPAFTNEGVPTLQRFLGGW